MQIAPIEGRGYELASQLLIRFFFLLFEDFFAKGKMRLSISVVFLLLNLLLCSVWSSAKKVKDDDFAEFDDFDKDEFVNGTCLDASTFAVHVLDSLFRKSVLIHAGNTFAIENTSR